jgi:excisionase family DNA binding protein
VPKSKPDLKLLLTMSEAEEFMGVSRRTLYRWRRKGLPCLRTAASGGRIVFRKKDLRRWAKEM